MKTYQVRRAQVSLGLFNDREIRSLLQKGKLLPNDEIDQGAGRWVTLASFVSAPAPAAASYSPDSQPPSSVSNAMSGRHFYLHAGGNRVGPLELSKLEGMAKAGFIDASAKLEDIATPGQVVPAGNHLSLSSSVPVAIPAPSSQPVLSHPTSSSTPSSGASSVVSSQTATAPTAKPKASYLNLWLKATLWIYGIGAVLGFLTGNLNGFIGALLVGLLVAPIKGAFWGWIIWLFKK
jgi:hypothetical protein